MRVVDIADVWGADAFFVPWDSGVKFMIFSPLYRPLLGFSLFICGDCVAPNASGPALQKRFEQGWLSEIVRVSVSKVRGFPAPFSTLLPPPWCHNLEPPRCAMPRPLCGTRPPM
jgi:hypothetical protein